MKLRLKAIACLGLLTILGGTAQAVQLPVTSQSATPTTNISQATEPLDLNLLAKTMSAFWQSDRFQTNSQTKFTVGSQGGEATIYLQSKIISQSWRKFRAEIAYTTPGKPPKTGNLIVSDGKQVCIYRADLQQYAVMSYSDFKDSGDWVLIGISSFASLEFPESDRKTVVAAGHLSEKNVLTYLNADGRNLTGSRRVVDGKEFYVYDYKQPGEGFVLSAFVNPQTANINQIQLVGKSKDLDINLTENILTRTPNPTINGNTFRFIPPKGAKRVKSLSINPF
ncbi:LolA family protein [Aliinostoc sp. HNIBRCY26]|uniref:LolA family protein n=1 Tax=Aliinostoc sp. HNIBRCY26 TaxID=3418997 RepID=UPI003CFCE367